MCVVHEAVEDGVGEGGVSEDVVPVIERELAGDDGRALGVPVVEDLEAIGSFTVTQGGESEVIEYEELGLGVTTGLILDKSNG